MDGKKIAWVYRKGFEKQGGSTECSPRSFAVCCGGTSGEVSPFHLFRGKTSQMLGFDMTAFQHGGLLPWKTCFWQPTNRSKNNFLKQLWHGKTSMFLCYCWYCKTSWSIFSFAANCGTFQISCSIFPSFSFLFLVVFLHDSKFHVPVWFFLFFLISKFHFNFWLFSFLISKFHVPYVFLFLISKFHFSSPFRDFQISFSILGDCPFLIL